MMQDEDIIRQVLKGDVDAFRLLVERYQYSVVRIVANFTGNTHIAEEIAQDVFFTAYRKLGTFDPAIGKFSTWLFTIANNMGINAMKKKKAQTSDDFPHKTEPTDPSDSLIKKELLDRLDKALQLLPSRLKRALVMAEFENLSYAQIAEIEAVEIGTIKSRINRAKKKLQSAMGESNGELI
jgi:RNA polymerase sigma-70 factor, ECF subfamily